MPGATAEQRERLRRVIESEPFLTMQTGPGTGGGGGKGDPEEPPPPPPTPPEGGSDGEG